jgi:hypothetical protein
MHWWKTRELATKIKNDGLNEKDKMQYYLAGTLFLLICTYITYTTPRELNVWLLTELIGLIIITIAGFRITFYSNKGPDGKDYVARIACLGFPLLVKILVLAIFIGVLAAIFDMVGESGEFEHEAVPVGLTLALTILYFWRLNIHLKYINS